MTSQCLTKKRGKTEDDETTTLTWNASSEISLTPLWRLLFLKKWPNPSLFFIYFRSFQTNNTTPTNQCEKMSKCPSRIRRCDSNPWPYLRESSPITTRPGLPPLYGDCLIEMFCFMDLFSRRRWTTGSVQLSNMCGKLPCMCGIIFWFVLNTTAYHLGLY